jgi:quinol monooxygenase YgiN
MGPTRQEAGCLGLNYFQSTRDSQLFYVHARWQDEAGFNHHATLPHTVRFIQRMEALVDQPLEVTRARLIA